MKASGIAIIGAVLVFGTATPPQQIISDEEACSECSIDVETVVRLGTADGPGALPAPPSDVAVDTHGRYWVVVPGHPVMVFGPDGRFDRTVGRTGEGPGEFRWAWRAAPAGDSMLVAEESGKISVFGPTFGLVQSVRLPLRISDLAVLRWPDAVIVSGAYRSTQGIGFPLHLVDMSVEPAVVRRSFGPDPKGELRAGAEWALEQSLGPPSDGSIFAVDRYRYRITRWATDGALLGGILRDATWFPPQSPGAVGLPDKPPDPLMVGTTQDSAMGLLWVLSSVPGPRWEASWAERVRLYGAPPPGALEVPGHMVPDAHELFATTIEALDLESHRVVVRETIDAYIFDVLPGALVVAYVEPGPDFYPAVDVLQLVVHDGS